MSKQIPPPSISDVSKVKIFDSSIDLDLKSEARGLLPNLRKFSVSQAFCPGISQFLLQGDSPNRDRFDHIFDDVFSPIVRACSRSLVWRDARPVESQDDHLPFEDPCNIDPPSRADCILASGTRGEEPRGELFVVDTNVLISGADRFSKWVKQTYANVAIPFVVLNEVSGLARQQDSDLGRRALKALEALAVVTDRKAFVRASVCGLRIDGHLTESLLGGFCEWKQDDSGAKRNPRWGRELWPFDVKTTDEAILRAAVNYQSRLVWNWKNTSAFTCAKDVIIVSDDVSLGVLAASHRVSVIKSKQLFEHLT
jgi:rRNA-processing protein FCF1